MRGKERKGHAEKPGEVLFTAAQLLDPGVYSLGDNKYLTIPVPAVAMHAKSGTRTIEVLDFRNDLANTSSSGWHHHRITFAEKKRFGVRHIGTTTTAIWNRGPERRPVEMIGAPVDHPAVNLADYAGRVSGINSIDFLAGVSVDNPLETMKIGEYVTESISTLLDHAGKQKPLRTSVTHYEMPFSLARGQHMPGNMPPDAIEGDYTGYEVEANLPFRDLRYPVLVRGVINGTNYVSTLIIPYEDGAYRTYTVQLSDMNLRRVIKNNRSHSGVALEPTSLKEGLYVGEVLESLMKTYNTGSSNSLLDW